MSPAAIIFKVSNRKRLSGETDFAFLKNVCNQYLNFMLRVIDRLFFIFIFLYIYFFYELLIGL